MITDLEARMAELRQRRQAGQEALEVELDRLKAMLSDHADGIRVSLDAEEKRIKRLMTLMDSRASAVTEAMASLSADHEATRKSLDANRVLLRRQARWAWGALGGACVAAGVILLLAGWAASRLIDGAALEADAIRVANVQELAKAREEGERAIAELHERLAAQRSEVERGIETVGVELAGMLSDRDALRAELEKFIALRNRLGIQLVESQTKPVIVVPEGQEIRRWGAPGLSNLARYNGRMYRVVDRK